MSDVRYMHTAMDLLETAKEMYEEGDLRELVIFFPNAKSAMYHFYATNGIKLSDVLLAKHHLEIIERRLAAEE